MNALLTTLRQRLADAWQGRIPREQRTLILAAVVIAVALWADLLWTAAEQRPRLQWQVDRLEHHTALVEQLAARIANAAEVGKTPGAGASMPLSALAGLTVQFTEHRYHITGKVDFDAWLAWLGELQHGSHVILVAARVRKTGTPGLVEVEGELERAH
jgi:type II secretory pathway component PulM